MNIDRPYSHSDSAVWIFFDVLNYIASRGWVHGGLGKNGGFYFASFHMRPEDADHVNEWLEDAIKKYEGGTKWTLRRHKHNRFFICPQDLTKALPIEGGYSAVEIEKIMEASPEWAELAEKDLLLLSDYLYEQHKNELKARS